MTGLEVATLAAMQAYGSVAAAGAGLYAAGSSVRQAQKGRAQTREQIARSESAQMRQERLQGERERAANRRKPNVIPGIAASGGIGSTMRTGPAGVPGGGSTALGGGVA